MANIDIKTINLGKRVYNNKMEDIKDLNGNVIGNDEGAIKSLVSKAFNENNNTIKNHQAWHDLNSLIVVTADEVEEPDYQRFLNLVSDYKKVGVNDTVIYKTNYKQKVTSILTATGTGVDFTRIPKNRKSIPATPLKHQFGVKYSISEMIQDPINEFRKAVDLVNEEKLKYKVSQAYNVVRQAATASRIPVGQIFNGAGITFKNFQDIERKLLRYGGNVRPVVIGDISLLSDLQMKEASTVISGTTIPLFLNDKMKESLLRDIGVEFISKSIAITIDNPYTSEMNNKVDLPINEAIMIAGGSEAPIKIRDFGDTAVLEETFDVETEEAYVKISSKMDVTLLLNRAVGYIKDTSITEY